MLDTLSLTLKISLICGIIAPLLNIFIDVFGIIAWKGYNYTVQSISDLPSVGSPIRNIVIPLYVISNILVIIYGFGVFTYDVQDRFLQLIGFLLVGNAIFTIGGLVFPKYLNEAINSANNYKNTIVMFLAVLFILIAVIVGIVAFQNWFRYISAGIIIFFIILTNIGLSLIPSMYPNQVVSGLQERTMAYSFNLWMFLMAVQLLLNSTN